MVAGSRRAKVLRLVVVAEQADQSLALQCPPFLFRCKGLQLDVYIPDTLFCPLLIGFDLAGIYGIASWMGIGGPSCTSHICGTETAVNIREAVYIRSVSDEEHWHNSTYRCGRWIETVLQYVC
jgi:hypothetical protein